MPNFSRRPVNDAERVWYERSIEPEAPERDSSGGAALAWSLLRLLTTAYLIAKFFGVA